MDERYEREYFTKVVEKSLNFSDVCRKLGFKNYCGNRQTIKKYIETYGIDISHFDFKPSYPRNKPNRLELENVLINSTKYVDTTSLKKKLYEAGLKERVCEICGQDENWMGMRISLILDHVNGINTDNRIENLRIVCPNCNAGLSTFSGKNIKHKVVSNYEYKKTRKGRMRVDHCTCGEVMTYGSKMCRRCFELECRKVERPPYEQLLIEISESSYSAVGRKYGVSYNAIRKWVRQYEKEKDKEKENKAH